MCSAAGDMLPPMTVYKSKTCSVYRTWCEDAPDDYVFAANKSGYFDGAKFVQWFKDVSINFHKRYCTGVKMSAKKLFG